MIYPDTLCYFVEGQEEMSIKEIREIKRKAYKIENQNNEKTRQMKRSSLSNGITPVRLLHNIIKELREKKEDDAFIESASPK